MTIRALVFDAYGTLYDVRSVQAKAEQLCPGRGEVITQVWRLKQLEYTWLCSLLQQYEDFWEVTRASLDFALRAGGVEPNDAVCGPLMENYLHLDPYPEAREALAALEGRKLAILSNGSPRMLSKTRAELGAGSVDRGRDQHRQRANIQAAPVLLHPRRAGARRSEGGCALRLVEQLRRRRRQGLRLQCRVDPPQRQHRPGYDVRHAARSRGRARPRSRPCSFGTDRFAEASLTDTPYPPLARCEGKSPVNDAAVERAVLGMSPVIRRVLG